MKQLKKKFRVYRKRWSMGNDEDPETYAEDSWEDIGTTYAVSEKQAVNNVRHRTMGDRYSSQYLPTMEIGHSVSGYHYKAIRA